MNNEIALRRSQIYGFLAGAFPYPEENWLEDTPLLADMTRELNAPALDLAERSLPLEQLRAEHRRAFGLSGSLCYETEYGLPHEFRQSQELADIAGFYRAFGFEVGGAVRERPDHLGAELEFMHLLALKEAYAAQTDHAERVQVCVEAQSKFLHEHLGRWIGLFAVGLARHAPDSPYAALARFASAFVKHDAERLGVPVEERNPQEVPPTPVIEDFSCEDCPASDLAERLPHRMKIANA